MCSYHFTINVLLYQDRVSHLIIHTSNITILLFCSHSLSCSVFLLFFCAPHLARFVCIFPHPEQSGHYVLAWKHGIAVLTAGDVKVTSNPRIRLMPPQGIIDTAARAHSNSYNLEIQNVRTTDAGDYACQIGSIVPKEIVHSLEVLGELVARSFGRVKPVEMIGFFSFSLRFCYDATNM